MAVRLWIFGDKHFLPELQNIAMRRLHDLLTVEYPSIETVLVAYENSPPKSVLRKIMMRDLLMGLKGKEENPACEGYLPDDLEELNGVPGFASDLAQILASVLRRHNHIVNHQDVEAFLIRGN